MSRRRPPFAYAWFFPAAALYGCLAVALWSWSLVVGAPVLPGLSSPAGHAHEMLFGYAMAVVAGFLLGPRPLPVIVALLGAWALARLTFLLWPGSWPAAVAAAGFSGGTAAAVLPRFVRSARKWRNRSVVVMVGGLAAVAVLAARGAGSAAAAFGGRTLLVAVILLASLMFFMGGRIIAPAVAGYLVRGGGRLEARVQPAMEGGGLVCLLGAGIGLALPVSGARWLAGVLLAAAAMLTAVRLVRWRLWRCAGRPDLLILGLGYGWLAVGLALLGGSMLTHRPPLTLSLHAVTIGALGTLTVAVMARTRLLSRYRDANVSAMAHVAALLMSGAALARMSETAGVVALAVSAALWCAATSIVTVVLIAANRAPRSPA